MLCWATLLVILLAINWIWTADAIQVGTFAFAALAIYLGGLTFWLVRREALRRGPPPPRPDPQAVPETSLAAVAVGLAIGCILFGLVWAKFLVWLGGGVLVLSLGRLVVELRCERASVRRAGGEERP
jgi:hypothetical protein